MINVITASLLIAASSHAQSFSCEKAKSPTEKAICGSDELKTLDLKLNELYKASLKSDSDPNKDVSKLKSDQVAWIKKTAMCQSDKICIQKAYWGRIAALSSAGALNSQSSAPSKNTNSLEFTYKKFHCKKGNSEVDFSYPVFSGADKQRASSSNDFVETTFTPRDKACDASEEDQSQTSDHVAVLKITSRVVVLKNDYSYMAAYPSEGTNTYLVVGSKNFDVGNGMTSKSFAAILTKIKAKFKKPKKAAKNSESDDEESCYDTYENVSEDTDHFFDFKDGKFILSVQLAHAMQACDSDIAIPKDEFLRSYVEHGEMRDALSTL